MAHVRIHRYELEDYELPQVCMRCGRPAAIQKYKNFAWYPPWVLIIFVMAMLPGAIVALILTKRMAVKVPLCEDHAWHFGGRILVILGTLLAGIVLIVLLATLFGRDHEDFIVVIGLLTLLAWLVTTLIVALTQIRPSEITDDTITLRGVDPKFRDALQQDRRNEDDEDYDDDYDDRPRRKPSSARGRRRDDRDEYDDEEPDEKRSRRRSPEDEEGYYDPETRSSR